MLISQTAEQIKALGALQDHCEIEAITLQSCTAMRAKHGTSFNAPFSAKPKVSNISQVFDGRELVVEVSFEYAAWDSADPPERVFSVNCTFEVSYRITDGHVPSESERTAFSKGTAVFNCWSYAREFLRDITARLGHQPPILPLLRIIPKKAEAKASEMPDHTARLETSQD